MVGTNKRQSRVASDTVSETTETFSVFSVFFSGVSESFGKFRKLMSG